MAMTKKCLLYCTKGKPEIVTFDIKDGGTQPHPSTPINGKIVAECDVETEEIKIFDKVNWKNENKISFTPVPSRNHRSELSTHSDGSQRTEGCFTYMESEREERNVSQPGD